MFTVEELQKMDKNKQFDIGKLTDQSQWVKGYQSEEFEKASPEVLKLFQENIRLKSEVERLTEEKETAWRKFKEKCNESIELSMLLDKRLTERAELQKQVDNLTEQRDIFKRLFENVNTSNFSTSSIIETMNSFYREQAEHLAGLKIEQAVKDKVREFARLVEFHSVATIENEVEYFTISSSGLSEILHENFGVDYSELYSCNGEVGW